MSDADLSVGPPGQVRANVDPDDAAGWDAAPPLDVEVVDVPLMTEPEVRAWLEGIGSVLAVTPVAHPLVVDHWKFQPEELDGLTPPVTRIVNRRPAMRRAIQNGDEVLAAIHLARYFGRNVNDLMAMRKLEREEFDGDADTDLDPEA